MIKLKKSRYLIAASICFIAILAVLGYYFFSPCNQTGKDTYLYVDADDTVDSVVVKATPLLHQHSLHGIVTLMRHMDYEKSIKIGRYLVGKNETTFTVFRRLRNGLQAPLQLTVPSVRTMNRLASELSKRLMPDSAAFAEVLTDTDICKSLGYDTATIVCLLIPNTYEMYWNVTPLQFLERMKSEHNRFWNDERKTKARHLQLSTNEVYTLASIIDEETANDKEKPMIAGMYYNRLMLRDGIYPHGMPLQADPTIKFALKDFGLRRIYNKLLTVDSPYNTYRHAGLPPGPIRMASVVGIEAVLNMVHHDYFYMCANADFSGTHAFARTYQEHLSNAARYSAALNQRGIK